MLLPPNEKIAPVVKLELQNFDNFWFEKYFLRIEQAEGTRNRASSLFLIAKTNYSIFLFIGGNAHLVSVLSCRDNH